MVKTATVLGLSALLFLGCDKSTSVIVARAIVTDPQASRFPLEGKWQSFESPVFGDDPAGEPYSVRRLQDGRYEISFEGKVCKAICQAVSLNDDHSQALLELQLVGEGFAGSKYLAVAAIQDEWLFYRFIDKPQELAECMAEDGYSAVIEHGMWCSTITADGNDLLNCVRKHIEEIVSAPSNRARRVAD
ncbi:hypothetical protein Pla123a_01570 [Posidoniimonas polymericola]|uniref:Uncharacterized protein n=1 Tax=Posidoniimonas polymericola TaxID=2528002 RepID=A0A5C5ZDW1_9BACT|nr:hypothetical protein [Posidoniimonas polymericola]TWT85350.1 hypothetical protein Pla123a_01570 [Posidoniimonas polymericola]